MVKRYSKIINFDDSHDICRVRFEAYPTDKRSKEASKVKRELLELLYSTPGLDLCHDTEYEKLKLTYSEDRWVLELEAFIPKTTGLT